MAWLRVEMNDVAVTKESTAETLSLGEETQRDTNLAFFGRMAGVNPSSMSRS